MALVENSRISINGITATIGPEAGTPTAANGAQVVGSSIDAGSTDFVGGVTGTTTATPAAGTQITVNFSVALPSVPKYVNVVARSAAAAAALEYVTNITVNGFSIATNGAPAASSALSFGYEVIL